MCRDSEVSIMTHYGLDGPVVEFQLVRFSAPVRTGSVGHPVFGTMGTGSLFAGVKRSGLGVDHPSPSSTEAKERVDIYISSPRL